MGLTGLLHKSPDPVRDFTLIQMVYTLAREMGLDTIPSLTQTSLFICNNPASQGLLETPFLQENLALMLEGGQELYDLTLERLAQIHGDKGWSKEHQALVSLLTSVFENSEESEDVTYFTEGLVG